MVFKKKIRTLENFHKIMLSINSVLNLELHCMSNGLTSEILETKIKLRKYFSDFLEFYLTIYMHIYYI